MKKSSIFIVIFGILFFSGCTENQNDYDKGYDGGWDGKNAPSYWATEKEKKGYQDGLDDSDMYDEGYDDAIEKKKPKYFNDDFYMDGYKEGKKDR